MSGDGSAVAPVVEAERRGEWRAAAAALERWITDRDLLGWDPYDALASPFVRALAPGRWSKVAWTQLLRRSPVQLRPLLRVPRLPNPKADALVLESRLRVGALAAARPLVERLERAVAPGGGWGYAFPWANREAYAPAGTPNAVVTSFAGHALLDALEAGVPVRESALVDAGAFLAERLQRLGGPNGTFCFSYTPLDRRGVHNASVLAASLLARLGARLDRSAWRDDARAAARFTLAAQRPDGSWPYGLSARSDWVDGLHTGYVLIALDRIDQALGPEAGRPAVERGLRYWRETFLVGPAVAHRPGRAFPVDMHAVAHAILTLLHFRARVPDAVGKARALARWSCAEMRAPDGSFHYLRHARWTNRLSYLRWVQAWMLRALTELAMVERAEA
jgi:hypothetical protein